MYILNTEVSVTFYTLYSHIIKVAANFDQVLFNHKAYIHKRSRLKDTHNSLIKPLHIQQPSIIEGAGCAKNNVDSPFIFARLIGPL